MLKRLFGPLTFAALLAACATTPSNNGYFPLPNDSVEGGTDAAASSDTAGADTAGTGTDVATCTPQCQGLECGDDGCGGSCGNCPEIAPVCSAAGKCQAQCQPNCVGKQCGPDGCGGTCGSCGTIGVCDTQGKCQVGYTYAVVDGSPYTEPDCNMTSSPGADLDVVALYRNGYLLGVGKPGTAKLFTAAQPACAGKGKGNVTDVTGKLNTKMYADNTPDTGYFSLSNNRVYVQIGECTQSTEDIRECDGLGPVITFEDGDELDIYEVDSIYKQGSGSFAAGIAPPNCLCIAEDYWVGVAMDMDSEPIQLGTFKGSKSAIPISVP